MTHVVRDTRCPSMYRIVLPNHEVTGILTLTRAQELVLRLTDEGTPPWADARHGVTAAAVTAGSL
jgi:hypothetical protein